MPELTAEGRRAVDELARQQGVSEDAVRVLLVALAAGGGTMAQFSHPDLGGLGQWSQGGMTMIGNMFDHGLKARIDTLCWELARRLREGSLLVPSASEASPWPTEFGSPASSGAQGDTRYAFFPERRRLVLQQGGRVTIHDTGEHRIGGVSQQQGSGQSLTFTSQHGPVRLADLPVVSPGASPGGSPGASPGGSPGASPGATAEARAAASRAVPATASALVDPLVQIERLAELHKKGILTEAEFVAKKTELLGRL